MPIITALCRLKLDIVRSLRPAWATKGDCVSRMEEMEDRDSQTWMQIERADKQGPRGSSWQQRIATEKPKSDSVLGPYLDSQATGTYYS